MNNINRQLKSGRSLIGKELTPEKVEKLEEEKATILAKMQDAKDKRHDDRMNAIRQHTAEVGKKTTQDVNDHTSKIVAPVVALFSGGSSEDPKERIDARRLQNAANVKANKEDMELKKKKIEAERELKKGRSAKAKKAEREQAYGPIIRTLTTSSGGTPLNPGPGDCSEDDPIEAEDCGEDEKRENASLVIGVPDPPPPAMPKVETSPKPKEKKENTEKKEKKEKEEKKEKTEKKKKKTETIVSWSPKANDATKGKLGSWVEAVVRILKTNRKDNMIERAFCSLNKDMDKQQFHCRVTWDGECASIGEGLCTVRHAPVDGLPSMIQWVR